MHRVITFVAACVVACAPSLVGACEITCATAEATGGAMSSMHACHHHATAPDDTRGLASIHGCAHADGLPGTTAEKLVPPAAMSVATVAAAYPIAKQPSLTHASWAAPPRPPDLSLRTIQLRI